MISKKYLSVKILTGDFAVYMQQYFGLGNCNTMKLYHMAQKKSFKKLTLKIPCYHGDPEHPV
jgi:hypothetical protein